MAQRNPGLEFIPDLIPKKRDFLHDIFIRFRTHNISVFFQKKSQIQIFNKSQMFASFK